MLMILTYRYCVLPTARQYRALEELRESQRQLYNAALEERIGCYRVTGKTRSYIDQAKALTTCRRDLPDMAALPVNIQRWTLKRLDDSFQAFFRRAKARKGKAGFPRFRGKARWDSFGFNQFKGISFGEKRLRFAGMPSLRVHLHRPLPDAADIRSCVFRREGRRWSVCFQIRVPITAAHAGDVVGIDAGLTTLATLSTGEEIANPRIGRKHEREQRRRQPALSRCKRGSKRRGKVRERLARLHRTIKNERATFLHQVSARLVREDRTLIFEKLNIGGMARGMLARCNHDAAWNKLVGFCRYKAAKAGGAIEEADPRGTTRDCSGCGEPVPKTLAERMHSCPRCGLVIGRDENAAR